MVHRKRYGSLRVCYGPLFFFFFCLAVWSSISEQGCLAQSRLPDPRCSKVTQETTRRFSDGSLLPFQKSYTALFEMTLLPKSITCYVREIHERGTINYDVVHLTCNNATEMNTIYYHFHDTADTVFEERDGLCTQTNVKDILLKYWGWMDHDTDNDTITKTAWDLLIFGPSAIFKNFIFKNKKIYLGDQDIDGLMCEEWLSCSKRDVEVHYFIAKKENQTSGNSLDAANMKTFPVKYEVISLASGQHVTYRILSFKHYADDHTLLEKSACKDLAGSLIRFRLPKIPVQFSYSQETIETWLADRSFTHGRTMHRFQVSHNDYLGLMRFDWTEISVQDSLNGIPNRLTTIRDYNTGTEYILNKQSGRCSSSRISSNTFDNDMFDGMLLSPRGFYFGWNTTIPLDHSFSFMGITNNRGMKCALWASTRYDIPDPSSGGIYNYPKVVLHYYVMENQQRGLLNSDADIPISSDLFIYNSTDSLKAIKRHTVNFYDFHTHLDATWRTFSIDECYSDHEEEEEEDSSLLLLAFPINDNNAMRTIMENKDLFINRLLFKLMDEVHISPTSITDIHVSKGPTSSDSGIDNSGVIVATIKLRAKASYITTFRQVTDKVPATTKLENIIVQNVSDAEECAKLCWMKEDFHCGSFYHCDQGTCILEEVSEGSVKGSVQGPLTEGSHCSHWMASSPKDTPFLDPLSSRAYQSILEAIRKDKFTLNIPIQRDILTIAASEALHYDNPAGRSTTKTHFPLRRRQVTFSDPDHVIDKVPTLEECMTRCLTWPFDRCLSISYLKKANQCMIDSTSFEYLDGSLLKTHADSDVYGKSYLREYDVVYGGVSLDTTTLMITKADHPDTCARHCSEERDRCLSFEWCHDKNECHHHSENVMDVTAKMMMDGQVNRTVVRQGIHTNTNCIHFSKKVDDLTFSQHHQQGTVNGHHKTLVAMNSGAASCAQSCLYWKDDSCESFDFCPSCEEEDQEVCGQENIGHQGLCFINVPHRIEAHPRIIYSQGCQHYKRRDFGGEAQVKDTTDPENRFTQGDMVGLAASMMLMGIMMTCGYLAILVLTAPNSYPLPPSSVQTMTYLSLKATQGESES